MKKTNPAVYLPIGIALGVSMGTALGVALDNLAVFLPLGIAMGSGIGVALMGAANANAKKDGKDADGDPETDGEG
jgi:hypothetical protein